MKLLPKVLLRFFLCSVIGLVLIFLAYDRQVTDDIDRALAEQELVQGFEKVDQFRENLKKTLEKYAFQDLIGRTSRDFLEFEELSDRLLKQNKYIAFVHLKNDKGETLLYKGSDYLHKITINEKAVAYYTATTEGIKELIAERPDGPPGIPSVTTRLDPKGQHLGSLSVGFSREALGERGKETVKRVRSRTWMHLGLALAFLGLGFSYLVRQVRKVGQLETRLAQTERLAHLGSVASGLVHEIRNPLNGISLNLELLQEELEGAGDTVKSRLTTLLQRIRPSVSHLEDLATEFLKYARPPRVQKTDDSLNAVVTGVADFVRPQCLRSRIELILDLDELLGPFPLDRENVRQVLMNLVVNAIQAMGRGGRLTLSTRLDGEGACYSVGDTGPGIPEEARSRIFELFYSTKEGGIGLGLPIARRLVEDHDGQITLESDPGKGTRFTVRLPRNPRPAASAAGEPSEGD